MIDEKKHIVFEYQITYISYLYRLFRHARPFLMSVFFGFLGGAILTGYFYTSLSIASFFGLLILLSLSKWQKFLIQNITIYDNDVYLKVFEFNKLVIDETFKKEDVRVIEKTASSSYRGVSYMVEIRTPNKVVYQYETMGWTRKQFDEILKNLNGEGVDYKKLKLW